MRRLQFVPDNPVTGTMDAVLTLLKHVALGAVRGLDGLTAMDPHDDYLHTRLNLPSLVPKGRYLVVASDYEPPGGSPLLRVARVGASGLVFGSARNDLVVPTEGVYTVPGTPGFPIATPLVFPAARARLQAFLADVSGTRGGSGRNPQRNHDRPAEQPPW